MKILKIKIPWDVYYENKYPYKGKHKNPYKTFRHTKYFTRKGLPIFSHNVRRFFNKFDFKSFSLQNQSDFIISNYSGFYDYLSSSIHNFSNTFVSVLLKVSKKDDVSVQHLNFINFGLYYLFLRRFHLRSKLRYLKLNKNNKNNKNNK